MILNETIGLQVINVNANVSIYLDPKDLDSDTEEDEVYVLAI
jgi:hypothetical protein